MPKPVILGSARTPIGKMGGSLSTLDATELGGIAIQAALERAGVEPGQVQHVIMGQVLQAGQGQIPPLHKSSERRAPLSHSRHAQRIPLLQAPRPKSPAQGNMV